MLIVLCCWARSSTCVPVPSGPWWLQSAAVAGHFHSPINGAGAAAAAAHRAVALLLRQPPLRFHVLRNNVMPKRVAQKGGLLGHTPRKRQLPGLQRGLLPRLVGRGGPPHAKPLPLPPVRGCRRATASTMVEQRRRAATRSRGGRRGDGSAAAAAACASTACCAAWTSPGGAKPRAANPDA